MTLTAKAATIRRVPNLDGDGTLGSGKGHPQSARGTSADPSYQIGAGQVKHLAIAEYDFAKDGALPFAALAGTGTGVWIPANAIVTHTWVQSVTPCVGPTNMGVTLVNDNDLVADASLATVFGQAAGVIVTGAIEPMTESGFLKTGTTPKEIIITATVAATSAGKASIFVEYVLTTTA